MFDSVAPFLSGAHSHDQRERAAAIIDAALKKEGVDINALCMEMIVQSPMIENDSYRDAFDKHFAEAEGKPVSGGGGPMVIAVAAWPHQGKTAVGAAIEHFLKDTGFTNVTVHAQEETDDKRYELKKMVDQAYTDTNFRAFLDKPIKIIEVNVSRKFRMSARPASNEE